MVTIRASFTSNALLCLTTSTGLFRLQGVAFGHSGSFFFQMHLPRTTLIQLAWVPNASDLPPAWAAEANGLWCFTINGEDVTPDLVRTRIPGTEPPPSPPTEEVVTPGTVLTWLGRRQALAPAPPPP